MYSLLAFFVLTNGFIYDMIKAYCLWSVFSIWKDEKMTVSNRELKSMVEFYKKDLVPKYDIPELWFSGQRRLPNTYEKGEGPFHIDKQGNSE